MSQPRSPKKDLQKYHSGNCMTPWGWAILEHQDQLIYRLEFWGGKRYPGIQNLVSDPISQETVGHLLLNPHRFSLKPQGTEFQQSVWQALLKIPYGTVKTYQEIAMAIGRPQSVRAVANAIGANPICVFIPCHRVIRSDGTLGGYSSGSGVDLKRQLMSAEGINLPSADLSF
jgi:methylated-DNA-[protein]-cysteine S-methyltransferase